MREVSCRVFDIFLRDLRKRGLDAQALVKGTSCELQHLRNRNERVDWQTFVQVMKNASEIWEPEQLVLLGGAFFKNPLIRPFALIGRILFTAKDFYHWMNKPRSGMGNQLFTCIEGSAKDLSENKVEIRLTMKKGYKPCIPFFLVSQGAIQEMPRLLGLGSSVVVREDTESGAIYEVEIPRGGGALTSVRKAVTWPFVAKAVARELEDANSVLTARYQELETARQLLDRQATQLQTAHSISKVIHGELNLQRTMEQVAKSLVEVAGFERAEVAVNAKTDGGRIEQKMATGTQSAEHSQLSFELTSRRQCLGEVRLFCSANSDLSERKELLEYLGPTVSMAVDNALTFTSVVDYRNNLEHKVKTRTIELSQARDRLGETVERLQEAQKIRDRIFSNINHEIRTPLSLITLALARFRKGLAGRLTHEAEEQLDAVSHNIHGLLYLVDGLLLLAASQEDKLRLKRDRFDLAKALRAMVVVWSPAAEEAGLTLTYAGPEVCGVFLDQRALERVVANLVSNAIKFTEEGGIAIKLSASENIEVTVTDTGIGIDETNHERIFGRFEQDKSSTKRNMSGSGIGLSIVKELVEAHDGTVFVEANPEGGTRFRVVVPRGIDASSEGDGDEVLPVDEAGDNVVALPPKRSSTVDVPIVQEISNDRPETILVAEDRPELRNALVDLLKSHFRLLVAPDGRTALRLAQEHLPDMLVSDVQMPEMDGLQLTRAFRALPGNRLAPVLLVTAFGDLRDRLSGFEAGAIDYVVKPFEPEELLARVRSLLSIRAMAIRLHATEHLASLGVLSSGLAHEIRNPANAVVNSIAPLRQMLPKELLEEGTAVGELFGVLEECARQISDLSSRLLGHTHEGKISLTMEQLSVLLSRAIALLGDTLQDTSIHVDFQYDEPVPCAPQFIVQVLVNLLENAANAQGKGGAIDVIAKREKDWVFMDVCDHGEGVKPEHRERIFDPFFTTKAPGVGTGLGLFNCRQALSKHGGTLRLMESEKGAVFRIELPAASSKQARDAVVLGTKPQAIEA